jgi:hypothetical protein
VESRHPGANISGLLGANGDREMTLRHGELEEAFQSVLSQSMPYQARMQKLDALSDQFGDYLSKETEIPSLTRAERLMAHDQKNQIPFTVDFNAFLRVVIAELSFCHHYGQKRSGDLCDEGCHFSGYLCAKVTNCLSNRFPKSARSLSKALAWLLGDQAAGLQHLEAVLPFALAHRIQWKDHAVAECEKELRNDPLEIYMAKKAVREMLRRYREQPHRFQKALAIACRIAEGDILTPVAGDHPLFHEILRDLGQEAQDG